MEKQTLETVDFPSVNAQWEKPDFEEIIVNCEVTSYANGETDLCS